MAISDLAFGNQTATLTTLEGCPETSKIAKEQFQQFNFNTIESITSQFESFLNTDNLYLKNYDLIYFDGNHSKEATLAYFEQLLPTINNETLWIFDDIHWSSAMEEAWEQIKEHPKVRVTIDTFQWGLVFFREEQAKEHFTIRL
ncbi:MAG: O-methyltransferase [Flavobacterium sp.]